MDVDRGTLLLLPSPVEDVPSPSTPSSFLFLWHIPNVLLIRISPPAILARYMLLLFDFFQLAERVSSLVFEP